MAIFRRPSHHPNIGIAGSLPGGAKGQTKQDAIVTKLRAALPGLMRDALSRRSEKRTGCAWGL